MNWRGVADITDRRSGMSIPLVIAQMSCDQPFDSATHEVVCLVKRHLYELAFAVPHAFRSSAGGAQPCLYMRVRHLDHTGGFCLHLGEIERLSEDLLQVMKYVQFENQRMGASKPVA
jgi:hypothetical protein